MQGSETKINPLKWLIETNLYIGFLEGHGSINPGCLRGSTLVCTFTKAKKQTKTIVYLAMRTLLAFGNQDSPCKPHYQLDVLEMHFLLQILRCSLLRTKILKELPLVTEKGSHKT